MATWFRERPQWGLAAVLSLLATGLGALVVSLVAVVVAASRVSADPSGRGEVASVVAGVSVFVSAWIWVAVVGGALMSILMRALPEMWRHRVLQRALVDVLAPRSRPRARGGRVPVVLVADDWPMAMGVPGRRAVVLVSAGLADQLTADQLAAVVAHEEAHLRWRHAAASRLAALLASALPGSARVRRFCAWLGELLEYAADDAAARRVGRAPLAEALHLLSTLRDDAQLVTRAERLAA